MRTLPNFPITPEIESRFWKLVNVIDDEDSCWEWKGHCWLKQGNTNGYGVFKVHLPTGWKRYKAHRVAYAIQYGHWPKNLSCHTCDNPKCVRGKHLFDGTNAENLADMTRKGRAATGTRTGRYTHPESTPRGEANFNAKLTEAEVLAIRATDVSKRGTKAALAREYGVSKVLIGLIIRRRAWNHLP